MTTAAEMLKVLSKGLSLDPLPPPRLRDDSLPHAPVRKHNLSLKNQQLAVKNALRYFPPSAHSELAPEFAKELTTYGHIYMYRFLPQFPISFYVHYGIDELWTFYKTFICTQHVILTAYALSDYPAKCQQAGAIMLMIMNNLDPAVAQFPQELVTYGGNGQVFSNWAQFWLVMQYLSQMTEEQTLVIYSGHPMGLFPSNSSSPRAVITNGMVIPNYSSRQNYDDMFALGVTMYGQMTAGSYCYIGPQGIVHGTTITVLNAGRKYLGVNDLSGKVFVTSGLGGMSGAQAKAAVIAGCVGVVCEVSEQALEKRFKQGWVLEKEADLNKLIDRIRLAKRNKEAVSIGFHGNVVSLWERLVEETKSSGELLVDLGSDQTSCHNPFNGGYFPVQLGYDEGRQVLAEDPARFRKLVEESLVRQVAAINFLADRGMFFWDYGNAFLLEARRAGADLGGEGLRFRYPSYVQDIMGDIFSLGFGPFRWVCTSRKPEDLVLTDKLAAQVFEEIINEGVPAVVEAQYHDNLRWIREAGYHGLVVGSQARILYSDCKGRKRLALVINAAVSAGKIQGPVVISRDHHDVSGTDSPYRETSNVEDGSAFTADMAVQNCIGDAFRGATWVALHNGGGVGWGEVINGGFGLLLDGTEEAGRRAALMLDWDVSNGVARRCWSGNKNARLATERAMKEDPLLTVTLPNDVTDPGILDNLFLS